MFFVLKKWTILYIICMFCLVVGFAMILRQGESVPASADALHSLGDRVLIIDPGHGGEDGGAVASDGTIESHINLSISLKIADLAEFLGWNVTLTRESDISLHSTDSKTLREKKVSDLKNRVALCEQVANGVLISIHQNSLTSAPSVKGAQVFYNEQSESSALAQSIQEVLNEVINRGNPKEIKPIGNSSYLMKNVTCPAVLIECGFLSNENETELLKSHDYQLKIAVNVLSAVFRHYKN